MRQLFEIPAEKEVRLWSKVEPNTLEQLDKPEDTVSDAGLFTNQVG